MQDDQTDPENWYSEEQATFGDRVAGARDAMGLSQAELARRLGIKLKTLRAWEEDLNEPRANKLQMLAGVLNVSIMWLINGEGDGLDGPTDPQPLQAEARALLAEMGRISDQFQTLAQRMQRLETRLSDLVQEPAE
ncbi:helix-turn-helix domain-containing protein [Actibacterium ureilyticum]|uniref:helix-turn-helix domain-containing protein n=1 Tax=Actibacterium ureilyticum TaxID=1590614 RepID=UPI000BAAD8E9|nr:helix-turn-helix transcriptional regulator [Actibacterium ureilyticum]